MKVIELVPELQEGGVERHLLWMTEKLVERGHEVLIISAGGKMTSLFHPQVKQWILPVHKKNPLTAWSCAQKIADRAKLEGWNILHAHSRVPAWIAMWASKKANIPYIVTGHVLFGNKSPWIYYPYRKAFKVICVSHAVEDGMVSCFSGNTQVIHNGLTEPPFYWKGPDSEDVTTRFLFVGRLSKVKGIQDIIEVLPRLQGSWSLDVLGDGPIMEELKNRVKDLDLEDRVTFYGFRDDPDYWMQRCSCLLFPSYGEGMPLTLARAIQMKVPVIASNILPVRELAKSDEGLLPPGNLHAWSNALQFFINTKKTICKFDPDIIPTLDQMTDTVETIYRKALMTYTV